MSHEPGGRLPLLLTIRANFPKASYTAVRLELCRPSDSHYHAGVGSSDNFTSVRSLCTDYSLHSPLRYSIPPVPIRILCNGAPVNVIFTHKKLLPPTFSRKHPASTCQYNTIQYNTKFVKRHVAVASEALNGVDVSSL